MRSRRPPAPGHRDGGQPPAGVPAARARRADGRSGRAAALAGAQRAVDAGHHAGHDRLELPPARPQPNRRCSVDWPCSRPAAPRRRPRPCATSMATTSRSTRSSISSPGSSTARSSSPITAPARLVSACSTRSVTSRPPGLPSAPTPARSKTPTSGGRRGWPSVLRRGCAPPSRGCGARPSKPSSTTCEWRSSGPSRRVGSRHWRWPTRSRSCG